LARPLRYNSSEMQSKIYVRLYEELNDYLPAGKRKRCFTKAVYEGATVEELLTLLGVPRSEVDLVLVNGESVPLSCVLGRDDRVSIYPVFESFDIKPVARVREEPLRRTRFVTGRNLGRLSAYLRLLGFDVLDARAWAPAAIVEAAEREKRILLTRSPGPVSPGLSRIYVVKAAKPKPQLIEVIRRFNLQREGACRGGRKAAGLRKLFAGDRPVAPAADCKR
jgi:sulfur carrier protein ThiS